MGSYKSNKANYLIIPDLQIPFENEKALSFCIRVAKEFQVPINNAFPERGGGGVLNVGDEVDQYFGSLYKKDPNGLHTPSSEIYESRRTILKWSKAFPNKCIAVSNHGLRWAKKAFEAEIPSQMLRPYKDVIGAPKGWRWKDRWVIKSKHPFCMIHGMGYSGIMGHRHAAIDNGFSTLIGHLHADAGINHVSTGGRQFWGMNVGCLIDKDAYAFAYGKNCRRKPILGVGVILDGGKTPIFIPLD